MLYNEDCLNVLISLEDNTIDMVYLDPPFFSQKIQTLRNSKGKQFEFSDVWDSRDAYLKYMRERLIELKRVLKKSGSIFLHCDSSASHYLKVLMDEVFGENNFQNEIIWTYRRWSNSRKGLLPAHQTIFFYSKSNRFSFNYEYGEYSPTTNLDQILQERERNDCGKSIYKRGDDGTVVLAKEKKGVPISDVWEIPFLNPKAKERTGYPTQKPIELLERIIRISTNEGDCVLDPFCGSGTTLVAAKLLGRKYIGIDTNPDAIELCKERIAVPFKTESMLLKNGISSYKTKTDEELAILSQLECDIVQRNRGIDAFLKKRYFGAPVAIKIQRSTESFGEAINLLYSAAKKKGCCFTVLISNSIRDNRIIIPENMIIIDRFNVKIEAEIQKRLSI